jgi:hypothetical protein
MELAGKEKEVCVGVVFNPTARGNGAYFSGSTEFLPERLRFILSGTLAKRISHHRSMGSQHSNELLEAQKMN